MLQTFETFFGATLGVSAGVFILLVVVLSLAGFVGKYTKKK